MSRRCLRITVTATFPANFLVNFIQKQAKKLDLEGTAQRDDTDEQKVRIAVCGEGDALDDFIDVLYTGAKGFELHELEVEPFLKDKEFRHVFRVIE
jgi:acylphosphatase